MKRLVLVIITAIVCGHSPVSGAEKERVFAAGYDAVWTACVKTANQEFTLEHSEKESGVLSFRTGTSMTSWGFTVGVTVVEVDKEHVRVTLNPQKKRFQFAWGAGDRISDKYFDAVRRNLFATQKSQKSPKQE